MSAIDDIVSKLKPVGQETKISHFMISQKDLAELLRLARIGAAQQWVPVTEETMPKIMDYDHHRAKVNVLCETISARMFVTTAIYTANEYAKTERGRAPRWEDLTGRLLGFKVLAWMPLPSLPRTNTQEVKINE